MTSLRPWYPFIALIFIFGVLLVPKFILSEDAASSRSRGPSTIPVRVATVEIGDLTESLNLNGVIVADESITVVIEDPGRVQSIEFKEGSTVQKGDLLLKLEDSELQAERLRILSNLELARLQEERQERLAASGSGTQEAWDEARFRRESLRAELALVDARIAKTKIRAPFTGQIGLRRVSVGAYLERSDPIVSLTGTEKRKVDFGVPERHQHRVALGDKVILRVSGLNRDFTAHITAIEPSLDPITRTLSCRAEIDANDAALKPGGFATVVLSIESFSDAVLVPSNAVIPDLDKQSVFVVEDGKAVSKSVQIGLRTKDKVQVLSGLKAGEELIVSGIQSVRPGASVEIIKD